MAGSILEGGPTEEGLEGLGGNVGRTSRQRKRPGRRSGGKSQTQGASEALRLQQSREAHGEERGLFIHYSPLWPLWGERVRAKTRAQSSVK